MGFDSIICFDRYNDPMKIGDFVVTKEIAEKFKECYGHNLIGFGICVTYFISFKGNLYNNIIKQITNVNYNVMLNDINKEKSKELYESLEKFISKYDSKEILKIQNIYEKDDDELFNDWCRQLTNKIVPSPKEIIGLAKIFKLCYENNLKIYASS